MGIERRVEELEKKLRPDPELCPECCGLIITEVVRWDGRREFPHGEPCPLCGSRGASGRIGRIVYYEPERS